MSKVNSDNKQLEALSALIDNQLSDQDSIGNVTSKSELLSSLYGSKQANPVLREKFERYHMIRDVMHKELGPVDMSGFGDRVAAAIAKEPTIVSPVRMTGQKDAEARAEAEAVSDTAVELDATVAKSDTLTDVTSSAADESVAAESVTDIRDAAAARSARTTPGGFWTGRVGAGVGGVAIAASAAMVALLGFNLLEQQEQGSNAIVAEQGGDVTVTTTLAGQTNADSSAPLATEKLSVQGTALATLAPGNGAQAVLPVTDQAALQNIQNIRQSAPAPIQFVSNASTHWVRSGESDTPRNPALEKRLNHLLGQHIESSPTSRFGGMFPYSRLAGYDVSQPAAQPGQSR